MILDRLKTFHRSMTAAGLTRVAFESEIGGVRLDVAFIAEQSPFLLLVGRGGRWLQVPVMPGYSINPVLPHQDYARLIEISGNRAAGRGMFRTGAFFFELNSRIPEAAETRMVMRPYMAAQIFPHVIDPEKRYFRGFQENTGGTTVSAQNLEKTRLLLGAEAEELCRKLNQSSIWSADPERSVRTLPELARLRRLASAAGTVAVAMPPAASGRQGGKAVAPSRTDVLRTLTLVAGPRGAGKTTLAQDLVRRLEGSVALDMGVFVQPLSGNGSAVPRQSLYAALLGLAFDILAQGLNPVCVADFEQELTDAAWLEGLREHLSASGVTLRVIQVTADIETRAARLRGQNAEPLAIPIEPAPPVGLKVEALTIETTRVGRDAAAARALSYVSGLG